jgi:hypothetical protein
VIVQNPRAPESNATNKEVAVGSRIRWIEPNQVYETSIRTVDRCFLFVPNHDKNNPLLAESSPPNALDPGTDIIPEPSVINTIGAAVGRALRNHPIQIHCFESNSNHIHVVFSATEKQLDNVAPFFRDVHSLIARGINRLRNREGHVFGGRSRIHPCLDDTVAEAKLVYAMTNCTKDHLIDKTSTSPLFSTYRHQGTGRTLKYWYIDHEAYWTAGGSRNKRHRLKNYLKWVNWSCVPLPHQQSMTDSQRQTWIRKNVNEIEDAVRKERRANGQTIIGFDKLKETDPRNRPKNPKESGPEPFCHASDKETAKEYQKKWKVFRDAHIQASADYRDGLFDRDFPDGSFRPPLIEVFRANAP